MSKIYEDTCWFLANEIKEVGFLYVMLRNFCDGIQASQCKKMHSFVYVFENMCGYVSRTNVSDFTDNVSEQK